MKRYFIQTFGCQMNQADSEKINMILLQSGFIKTSDFKDAGLVIINTCSVREKWENRVFWMVREIEKNDSIKNKNNHSETKKTIIWITGCMVRKTWLSKIYLDENIDRNRAKKIEYISSKNAIFNNDDKLFPRLDYLDFTLRIEEIKYIPFILTHIFWEKIWNENAFDDYLKTKQQRENPSSASIVIQTWCDNFCSFCIVPYTRGKEISRDKEDILKEIKEAVDSWAKEITLVWQNVNSYWKQFVDKKLWNQEKSNRIVKKDDKYTFKSPFRDLLDDIDNISGLDRIRFTSSNPHDMTKDILDSHFDLKNTCNYLHFALQSGSNTMLKRMNRKHSYEDFRDMVFYLRKKDPLFSISTDIIVWYSWETQSMFEETINAFRECEFDFCYTARYSVRPWTIASKIYKDDIPDSIKSERWHILNDLLLENIQKRNKLMLWTKQEVLISWEKDSYLFGRTRNFKEVFIDFSKNMDIMKKYKIWDLIDVKITDLDRYVLNWEIII